MVRMFLLICAATVLDFASNGRSVEGFGLRNFARGSNGSRSVCTDANAQMYSHDFHNCFVDRKYKDSARDLENIVDRILEHASACIRNSSRSCRPDYKGFIAIMDKVISQMKDYSYVYLELITHGRGKIKDLDCVETRLSNETYQNCFEEVSWNETLSSEEKFQEEAEDAISCTNNSHKQCSTAAKTSLNKIVRTVLGVKQPQKENIEEEAPPKPWRWYDYIIQPIVSVWKSIRSFFGF